jgi:hypothetical protein
LGSWVVFASAKAQYQNFGDVVLRQQMLKTFGDVGRIHVYVGQSPRKYIEFISRGRDVREYTGRVRWLLCLIRHAVMRRAVLVISPGPQRLEDRPLFIAAESFAICLTTVLRLFGCHAIKYGRSFEGTDPLMTRLVRIHSRLLTATTVRDTRSLNILGGAGEVCPDVAVDWGDEQPEFGSGDWLGISIRGDRNYSVIQVSDSANRICDTLGLSPIVLCQVYSDIPFARELATRLACPMKYVSVLNEGSVEVMRAHWRECSAMYSDRLHSLIFGLVHGALPILPSMASNAKVEEAFRSIGINPASAMWDEGQPSLETLDKVRLTATRTVLESRTALRESNASLRSLVQLDG